MSGRKYPLHFHYMWACPYTKEWEVMHMWACLYTVAEWDVMHMWAGLYTKEWNVMHILAGLYTVAEWDVMHMWACLHTVAEWDVMHMWACLYTVAEWDVMHMWAGLYTVAEWDVMHMWACLYTVAEWSFMSYSYGMTSQYCSTWKVHATILKAMFDQPSQSFNTLEGQTRPFLCGGLIWSLWLPIHSDIVYIYILVHKKNNYY